jgi:hypothetical protein
MPQEEHKKTERRRYLRLDTVFPVSFRLISLDGNDYLSGEWLQGFTKDVSKGGICLMVNNLKADYLKLLENRQVRLSLEIEMPILKKPARAEARITWIREDADISNRYIIGLQYDKVNHLHNRRIMRYAWTKKLFVPAISALIVLLLLGIGINSYFNLKLIRGNKALIVQLVKITQESHAAKQHIQKISRDKEELRLKIEALQLNIKNAEEEKSRLLAEAELSKAKVGQRLQDLDVLTARLAKEKDALQERLIGLQQKETVISEDILRIDRRKSALERENFDRMYHWLKVHQNPKSGLVASFEGDNEIEKWAFIYDQSLAAQSYTFFSDFERAEKILDFFKNKAKRQGNFFFNAYYADDGQPAEYTVHIGPNLWVGIAILQYTAKTQDFGYLGLAEQIAEAVINLQNEDHDGGIRGGPGLSWYSTEHNLDAYAFFNMLYRLTGKKLYLQAQDKAFSWLLENTYAKEELPVRRGKGDSTIATDTYAWSIAAIGPEKLEEAGLKPDRIMEFAEENCAVEVEYLRPEGYTVRIKGFDFARQRHLARGGVVSSEWTAQMVIAFKIMSAFYSKKNIPDQSRAYAMKADEYLSELSKMIISSASPSGQGEGCLPYATNDYVDTGHGWMTPKGRSTGSVAGTAYTIFAYYNYNPLEVKER